jgi:glycosyltransferase involved in cell wall biosynthesis
MFMIFRMEFKPFFSIIIPSYNRAALIIETLNSVCSQTFQNWECIVVDDGSTDTTRDVIEALSIQDDRIRYIYQDNAERSNARNNGIRNAKGEWICFLDSDDAFDP